MAKETTTPVSGKSALPPKGLPDAPGVYFFMGSRGKLLYIGKATSLSDRVRSYFASDIVRTRGPKIVSMLEQARSVKWRTTDSVLEALLLEAHLIKKHQPPYNTDVKDDKSWNQVVVTREKFPRILLARSRNLVPDQAVRNGRTAFRLPDGTPIKYAFGPFPSGGQLREALQIVRRIFPYRDQCVPLAALKDKTKAKPCFHAALGLCPGVCTGAVNPREYASTVRRIRMFFEGKTRDVARSLERAMLAAAKREEFEKAESFKRTLFALRHIQDVALVKKDFDGPAEESGFRIEAYDVAHLSGQSVVGVMTVVEGGQSKRSDYRKFGLVRGNHDIGNLTDMFVRRLRHPEWPLPRLIVTDGGEPQRRAVMRVLSEAGLGIPVVSVVKDERHQPRDILGPAALAAKHRSAILLANAEAHRFSVTFHRARRKKRFLNR